MLKMIASFLTLLPDELLYSAFARYSTMFAFPSGKKVREDLFGSSTATPVVDLPSGLTDFVERLPPNAPYSVEMIIDRHTLLPYYEPFLGVEKANAARNIMRGPPRQGLHRLLNVTGPSMASPRTLRFCQTCSDEDAEKFGVYYWHRVHQTPGVIVCNKHQCLLMSSSIVRRNRTNRHYFYPLTQSLIDSGVSLLKPKGEKRHLSWIAEDSSFLLDQLVGKKTRENISERYLSLLSERGWVDRRGRPAWNVLENTFLEYYGSDLLGALEVTTSNFGTGNSWISNLFYRNRLHPPLRHIILMQFLGVSVSEFFQIENETQSADNRGVRGTVMDVHDGPCRNPLCLEYRSEYRAIIKRMTNVGRLVRIECSRCHYSYEADANNTRICITINPGDLWVSHFTMLSQRSNASWTLASKELGMRKEILERFALRFRISTVRLDQFISRGKPLSEEVKARRFARARKRRRDDLMSVLSMSPRLSRSDIARQHPMLYKWLKKNDAQWFEAKAPAKQLWSSSHVNWEGRDRALASQIPTAIENILKSPDCPRRLTFTSIAGAIGSANQMGRQVDKLPLTTKAIRENLETLEDYGKRCLNWSAQKFINEGVVPSPLMLARRARFPGQKQAREVADLDVICLSIEKELAKP